MVALRLAGLEIGAEQLNKQMTGEGEYAKQMLQCKPRLAHHLRVQEQLFRKRTWSVLHNTVSGQFVRVDCRLWSALRQLRGELSLAEWLQAHEAAFGKVALLESIAQLHRHGLLNGMPAAKGDSLRASKAGGFNPLMVKLPLLNPTPLLGKLARISSPVSGRIALLTIALLAGIAAVIAVLDSERLMFDWQRVLSRPEQWWQYLIIYPCLKGMHELAHGLTLQRLGGQVREAGISLLVLVPIPYVDATNAWSLAHRKDRLLVTGAGMLSDITLASVALFSWYVLEPGGITDMAFSIVLMSGVSIFVFNANPLLKFDGYYLLEDLLDSPGLARRSVAYWQYLFKRYLFLAKGLSRPFVAVGERRWLLPYGVASLCYRVVLSMVISLFLIRQFHELGMVLAAFSIIPLFIKPLPRLVRYLFLSVQLEQVRRRAFTRLVLLCLLVAVPVIAIPLPSSTRAEGILWVPEQAEIYASEQGQLIRWFVVNGERVVKGQHLMQLASPELTIELQRYESSIALLELQHAALRSASPELAAKRKVEIEQQRVIAVRLQKRIEALNVYATHAGRIAFDQNKLLTGQHIEQGQLLLYLIEEDALVVRAVVDQRQLGRVENGVIKANVRLAADITTSLPATLSRQVPAANNRLPSLALANAGFGGIDMESRQADAKTREQIFHLELTLAPTMGEQGLGGRAFITLQHPAETLGKRWWRGSRQLFIKHLGA
ncbi:HlyD family efflux transporter periplasmic adaptor subunit [Granulosicoccus antarcticus]|uniref:RND efflux pump membrane fusion protein barrel-sandwich domain-containing protein n=1 Tax=Granulosicoccus antarcticus IMCC3135 TaxID=1192854 RepID=A0A2Z2NTG1_9GAMM|nr:HlyD family efflux transporter periplasmic adaptor subunit [Granulosicoccus antarcticus]ASJ70404.1 hypothetical protein IMCC3135_01425 [Granulosicoccus antarcticus IMCC3135]